MDYENLSVKLRQTFGLGDKPQASSRFYARLEREVEVKGDVVWRIIREVWEESQAPRITDKGHYFRFVCWVRLREFGYLKRGNEAREPALAKATVEKVASKTELPAQERPEVLPGESYRQYFDRTILMRGRAGLAGANGEKG